MKFIHRATTTQSSKLTCELSTFNELISRECSDKLTIEQYFSESEHLKPLIPLLTAHGMEYMDSLRCANEKEGEAIVEAIESGLQKALEEKQAGAEASSKDDAKKEQAELEDQDEVTAEQLLTKWKLSEFWEPFQVQLSFFASHRLARVLDTTGRGLR